MLTHWGPSWIQQFSPGGFGVRLFFVISGFLITGILLKGRGRLDAGDSFWEEMKTFYARRTLRIFPPYYALLAVFIVAGLLGHHLASGMPWHLAYLSNFYVFKNAEWGHATGHLWSLAVEEQFYLLWPAVVFLTPRAAFRPLLFGLIGISLAFRLGLGLAGFDLQTQSAVLLPSCLDTLCLGALLASITQTDRIPTKTLALIGVSGLLGYAAITVGRSHLPLIGVGFNLAVGLFSFAILGAVVQRQHERRFAWLNWAPLQYLGRRSYGLYLYHGVAALLVDRLSHDSLTIYPRIAACFLVAVAIASLSWVVLEQPILKLKDRFRYGQRQPQVGRAADEAVA
jgi:peptidoglycan/LPS O-acetylase OafA/YrhL